MVTQATQWSGNFKDEVFFKNVMFYKITKNSKKKKMLGNEIAKTATEL